MKEKPKNQKIPNKIFVPVVFLFLLAIGYFLFFPQLTNLDETSNGAEKPGEENGNELGSGETPPGTLINGNESANNSPLDTEENSSQGMSESDFEDNPLIGEHDSNPGTERNTDEENTPNNDGEETGEEPPIEVNEECFNNCFEAEENYEECLIICEGR